MRILASLAWKEWCEVRAFLWIGLGVFLGLPFADGLEQMWLLPSHRFFIHTDWYVVAFGGVLATLVSVGIACRDFQGHLEDFWRSRPMHVAGWLVVKYFIGLLVVFTACLVPPVVEWLVNQREFTPGNWDQLTICAPQWLAIYSLGFLSGCVVRRTAHAAMLALAAMLLLYTMPMILPPLRWFSPNWNSFDWKGALKWRKLQFIASFAGLAVAVFLFSLLAVRRNWKAESGRKMMYGAVAAVILIVFSSAAFRLGTSLPVLQQIDLPKGEVIDRIVFESPKGHVHAHTGEWDQKKAAYTENHTREITVTSAGIELGDPVQIAQPLEQLPFIGSFSTMHPDFAYALNGVGEDVQKIQLLVQNRSGSTLKTIPLNWQFNMYGNYEEYPRLYAWNDRIYIFNNRRLIMMNIQDPASPQLISDSPFTYIRNYGGIFSGQAVVDWPLPELPDMPMKERLKVVMARFWYGAAFDGEIFCYPHETDADVSILEYRLTNLTDTSARFERVAEYKTTMVDNFFGRQQYGAMTLQNGLLYISQNGGSGLFNPLVSVFETREPRAMQLIGHFSAPGAWNVFPLPDGRALAGGSADWHLGDSKLYLVGPPPQR